MLQYKHIQKYACDLSLVLTLKRNESFPCEIILRSTGSVSHLIPKEVFPFLRSGSRFEAKRGVEFCHSTSNASRIPRKVGNGVS